MNQTRLRLPPLGAEVSPSWFLGALVGVWVISCVPLAFSTYPPLLDYPFHLARIHVMAHLDEIGLFQEAYRQESFFLPNVGMDILVLALSSVLPLDVAGRVFIALLFLLILSGCAFLNWSIFRRLTLWPLVCALFLYNWILLVGLLNYLLGVGVVLWALGAWVATSRARPAVQLGTGAAFAVVLFFCHISAFGVFALAVSGFELHRSRRQHRSLPRAFAAAAIRLTPVFVTPVVFFFVSSTGAQTSAEVEWLWWARPFAFRTLLSAKWAIDLFLWAALLSIAWWVKRRDLRVDRSLHLGILFLFIAFLVLPESLITGWYVATRLIIAIALIALAATVPAGGAPMKSPWLTLSLVAFVAYRSLVLSFTWQSHAALMGELIAAFERIPEQSVVYSATTEEYPPAWRRERMQPPVWHWASLAVLTGNALVPSMYAEPGQQPVRMSDRFQPIRDYQGTAPMLLGNQGLPDILSRISALSQEVGLRRPVYLLILDPEEAQAGPVPGARAIARGSRFVLLEPVSAHAPRGPDGNERSAAATDVRPWRSRQEEGRGG